MNFISILKLIACILTAATGALGLFAPNSTVGFTGLSPVGGRGVTEIRAIFGALFIALGLAPFYFGGDTYKMLGLTYLAIAIVRAISIFIDKSSVQSNWISLVVEVILGVILVL